LDPDDLSRFIGAILGLWGSGYIPDRVKVSALTCLIPVLRYEHFTGNLKNVLKEQLADSDAGVRAVAEHILTMWERERDAEEEVEEEAGAENRQVTPSPTQAVGATRVDRPELQLTTWNITTFTDNNIDANRIRKLADDLMGPECSRYPDLLFVQEVMNGRDGKRAMERLKNEMNSLDSRVGPERYKHAVEDQAGGGEGYGVVWDVQKLGENPPEMELWENAKSDPPPFAVSDSDSDSLASAQAFVRATWPEDKVDFKRAPLFVRFNNDEWGEVVFCTVHTDTGRGSLDNLTHVQGEALLLQAALAAGAAAGRALVLCGDINEDQTAKPPLRLKQWAPKREDQQLGDWHQDARVGSNENLYKKLREMVREPFFDRFQHALAKRVSTNAWPIVVDPRHNDDIYVSKSHFDVEKLNANASMRGLHELIRHTYTQLIRKPDINSQQDVYHRLVKQRFSDHLPVSATLVLRPRQPSFGSNAAAEPREDSDSGSEPEATATEGSYRAGLLAARDEAVRRERERARTGAAWTRTESGWTLRRT
jgi:endonuclease/exonuclease/phosphatase family metal-dependent hydrolase